MAGAMRKMGIYLGLVEDDDHRGDHDYADEDYSGEPEQDTRFAGPDTSHDRPSRYAAAPETTEIAAPARRTTRPAERVARPTWGPSGASAITPRAAATTTADAPYRITTLHPRTYNEARTIGEHFREGVPVIMNLTEMDDSDAKRLVDFAAGLSFGLRGSIERVTNKVFLLSPQNVSVTAEDKAKIVEGGFFNQS